MRSSLGRVLFLSVGLSACRVATGVDDYTFYPACAPLSTATCYEARAETLNIGACRAGEKTCNAQGTAYGECRFQILPKAADDCAAQEDDNCDGSLPPACTGALGWTRFDTNDASRSLGFGVDDHDRGILSGESSVCDNMNNCSLFGSARSYEADGDLYWSVINGCFNCNGVAVTAAKNGVYEIDAELTKGSTPTSLFLFKRQTEGGVLGWGQPTFNGVPADTAVTAFKDRAWMVTTVTSSVDLDGDKMPDLSAPNIVVQGTSPTGDVLAAAAYPGRARSVAVGPGQKDLDANTSVVIAGCFNGHASFGPSCAVDASDKAGMAFDGFVARLEHRPGIAVGAKLDCAWVKPIPLKAKEGDCRLRVALDARGRTTVAVSTGVGLVTARLGPDGAEDPSWLKLNAVASGASASLALAGLTLDPFENPTILANFNGSINVVGGTTLTTKSPAGLVWKLDKQRGDVVWARTITAESSVALVGFGAASTGDVIVGGTFNGQLFADPAPSATPTPVAGASGKGSFVRLFRP